MNKDESKMFYYYTRWSLNEDGLKGIHHSTWITKNNPREFLDCCILEKLWMYCQFETEAEMLAFAKTVGL